MHRTNGNVYYVYDEAGHLLGEYASNGNPNQETIWLGDTPVLIFRTSSQERIADNNSTATSAKAVVTGTWATATTIKGYYGSNYLSHVATTSTTDNVTYTITPTATQSFNVYARWVAQATNASNATYTIVPNTTGSTPQVVTVNQQQNGGTWNYLGTVNLNSANPMTITLSGQGNGIVVADAVKIVPNTTSATQASAFNIYTDHLNTPREIRNHANQTRWTWYPEQSGALGAGLPNENPNVPALGVFTYNLRFPGQLYDAASQLSYNYYRDYSSRTGRYIESDPIGLEGGINTYAYVGGNPVSRVDPNGLSWADAIALTYAWATGTGSQHQDFGPGSSEAAEMQNAPGVLAAKALYRKKNAQKIKNNCDTSTLEPVTNYAGHFGLKGLFESGLNPTEQFIGSYRVDIYPAADGQINVVINNTSSFQSFAYGLGPEWNRSQFGPMGNMSQTISFPASVR
ncbi:golvesin C-terminal-like domain-containing protein [Candidatus Nitrotoga sp. 1052]|uniref:golvesin C-terminal-like domain-containing protein n=1 Tax=Candidatus Nitrotoga sp. 1052 TaxID=2886964 RepID=UPI001EF6E913|nr:RHS repeat-associated core domain-containing protein [Candidatus Nitrotoga sp. 1052]CAH1082874.1 hypothetical protein NTG1052_430007 [Candidatus Nitrotoga sp. 1052]